MKNKMHIVRTLVFMAMAMCMAFFAVAPKQEALSQKAKAHETQDNTGTDDAQPRLVSYEAIVPAFQINIAHDLLFTFEFFIFQEEKEYRPSFEIPAFFNHYLKILFQRIISPNAP